MKTIAMLIVCLTFCFASFAQNNLSKDSLRTQYLKKYKNRKLVGDIFLGTGIGLFATGIIIDRTKPQELLPGFAYEFFGVVGALISVPFLISSARNKSKAMMIELKPQPTTLLQHNINFHPTLSLHIPL